MMNPSMILIIAFSVVAQVQLSLSIDLNNHTIADAEAARKEANASLVELEYYAENLIKGFNKSGAVNDTMHSIADPVEKLYIDHRARASVEFDTIIASLQKLVRHVESVDVSVASKNISLQDFKKDLVNISEQVAAADQTNERFKKLSKEEAKDFRHGFRNVKKRGLDMLKQLRHAVDEAASRWKTAARKVKDAERKSHLPEKQYERAYDHVEHECDQIRDKAEQFAERAEDKVENHFDKVEDALHEQLDLVHASMSKEEHRRKQLLNNITDRVKVFQTKLNRLEASAKQVNGIAEKTTDAMPGNYKTHTFAVVALLRVLSYLLFKVCRSSKKKQEPTQANEPT